jgi:hypothetical protein
MKLTLDSEQLNVESFDPAASDFTDPTRPMFGVIATVPDYCTVSPTCMYNCNP